MSIYDNAGVALIPSGTKASKLYSVLPANGDGDFTHSRSLTTATRVNKDGLIEGVAADVPRLDYPLIDGVVQDCPALLLEPTRTNRSQNTEAFNNWSGGSTLVTANQAIAPDGNLTADQLTKTGSFSAIGRTETLSTSVVDTVFSVFVKEDTTDRITLRVASGSNDVRRYFDLTNETSGNSGGNSIGFVSDKIEKYPNGWYRVSVICTSNASTVGLNIYAGQAGNTTYDGEVYIWGSQLEEGDYITSYMPNSSTTTTRSQDLCNGSGTSAEFNDSEGVLFIECSLFTNSGENNYFSIGDTTGTRDGVELHFRSESSRIRGIIYSNDSVTVNISTYSFNKTNNNKIAFKYKDNDFAIWVNGTEAVTASSGAAPLKLSNLQFADANNSNRWYGKCKQVLVFNEALSDSELQTLTS